MIELVYLDSPRINRLVNVAAHFRALRSISERAGIPVAGQVVFTADGVRRALQASAATVLYLLGHSEGSGGMVAGGAPALDGSALAAWLPRQARRLPRVILFNTCDAVASGLVRAAREAGISAVVAANGPIRIDRMCAYAEALLRTWLEMGASLAEATRFANDAFSHVGMRVVDSSDRAEDTAPGDHVFSCDRSTSGTTGSLQITIAGTDQPCLPGIIRADPDPTGEPGSKLT